VQINKTHFKSGGYILHYAVCLIITTSVQNIRKSDSLSRNAIVYSLSISSLLLTFIFYLLTKTHTRSFLLSVVAVRWP